MSDRIIAVIRTAVPAAVGAAATWAAKRLGVHIDSTGLATSATATVGVAYYLVVGSLEQRWPAIGVLLGVPSSPSYTKPPAPFETTAPAAAPVDLSQVFPAGTTITIPGDPEPVEPTSFTVTIGPDGAQIVPNLAQNVTNEATPEAAA